MQCNRKGSQPMLSGYFGFALVVILFSISCYWWESIVICIGSKPQNLLTSIMKQHSISILKK